MHVARRRNETHEPIGDRRKAVGADCADHGLELQKRIHNILLRERLRTLGAESKGFAGAVRIMGLSTTFANTVEAGRVSAISASFKNAKAEPPGGLTQPLAAARSL